MENIKTLIEQVRQSAAKELEFCNIIDTPNVCAIIHSSEANKQKVIDLIVQYVGKNGMSIGEAINYIERDNNPNSNNY
jgi:hypothetical protein